MEKNGRAGSENDKNEKENIGIGISRYADEYN
jgi:hypothetical protein